MFYIGTEKTIKNITNAGKTETGFKLNVIYTDGAIEELIIETPTGGSGSGTQAKTVKNITIDQMNDGLGIWYTDGDYQRLRMETIPALSKIIVDVEKDLETGELVFKRIDTTTIRIKL